MRLVSYLTENGEPAVGRVDNDEVRRLIGVSELDATTIPLLHDLAAEETAVPLASLRLRPVVPAPSKVFCVGLNYKAHIEETKRTDSDYPVLFPKYASSLIAAGDPIEIPVESEFVDYEAELAVVIGKAGRRISRENAHEHVLGYAPANDITMRDYQYKTHQWVQGKAWDDSTPVGPVLVTADEVDATRLEMKLILNGEVMQSVNTELMIFDVPTLIATISEFTELRPGDLILTGTPGGVGYRRDPQVRLQDGDVVEVEISELGRLANPVRLESRRDAAARA